MLSRVHESDKKTTETIAPPRSMRGGGVNLVLVDGTVVFMGNGLDPRTFQRLGNRKDGNTVNADSF